MREYNAHSSDSKFIITYDVENELYRVSESFSQMFPIENREFSKEVFYDELLQMGRLSPELSIKFQKAIDKIVKSEQQAAASEEIYLRNRTDELYWYRMDFILSIPGKQIIVSFTNISDSVKYTQHLLKLSRFDELTGLYTKTVFNNTMDKIIEPYAVLYFDICHFKAINNFFGQAGGDLLLIHIAEVLVRLLGNNGFATRISGDRFAVILLTDKVYVELFIESLIKEISSYEGFNVLCNVGIYINRPEEQMSASLKIDRANMAQAVVKGNYSKIFNYYTDDLAVSLVNEQGVTAGMVDALDSNQFVLYFQPQVSHLTKRITGAEALVRWIHPKVGMIPPSSFIPIFEKNNFITDLDMYVFEQACAFLRKCMNQGIPLVPVSTNFSRFDVVQPNFIDNIEEIRCRYNVPVDKIRIEITESAVVEGSEYINSIVRKLQSYGYVVEMDDFGSGYSSLNVLKDINFDIIKLDMKFMSNEKVNERCKTILASVVDMSSKLSMSIIAEGVETESQADFLRDIGCDIIQGYFYSKPICEEEYISKLKENLK